MTDKRITEGGPYVWQAAVWPDGLWWEPAPVRAALVGLERGRARLGALAELIGLAERARVEADAVAEEALSTSRIEGEALDRDSVRSSVARHLGLDSAGLKLRAPRRVDGLVQVLLDATRAAEQPLTAERLYGWHAALFPTGRSGLRAIDVGAWRRGPEPMQVVSGAFGQRVVHFEAPPSARVADEMRAFLAWFEGGPTRAEGALHAALAHLRFVTVHPFDDGNGRLGRAVSDLALARGQGPAVRLWSLSARIDAERRDYYSQLQAAQRGTGDITAWLVWMLGCMERAVLQAELVVQAVISRLRFWQAHAELDLNARQRKLVRRLLEAGPDGFEGGMSTRKAVSLTRASRATAQRDLARLVELGVLTPLAAGGRSSAYALTWWATQPADSRP